MHRILTALVVISLGLLVACGPARIPVAEVPTVAPSATATPLPTPTDAWYGTPRPTGTATVTPTATPCPGGRCPTPTVTPTATRRPPTATPLTLKGKILFLTDREGMSWFSGPAVWMMDPDGSHQMPCPDPAAYDRALQAQAWSPDGNTRVFVGPDAQIHVEFPQSGGSWEVSKTGRGIAYDPAWSPVDDRIAFVSNESGAGDEIYVIRSNGDGLSRLTYDQTQAWDKFPTWSPDGRRIAFWSSRTGNKQIWVMNADGGEQRNLSQNGFNDFEPVWVR